MIVTGGGRGIGAGIARVFAAEGAHVLIATRTESRGQRVARAIEKAGGTASAMATDVTSRDDINAMIREAGSRTARLTSSSTTPASIPSARS